MDSDSVRNRGYELKEQIGAGGFGVVYRARQPSVGRDVAIKVILPQIARDPLFVQLFEQEARLAAQLEHPNIVPLYDYWQDLERAYLVMRWLRGGSLSDLMTKGPIDTETTKKIISQIASALDTAHKKGVIHRDLKPSNILLDQEGNAYLSDFGIATHVISSSAGSATGSIVGSPAYMAPEQITGGETTTKSDLYSLGLILYEMVTGEAPFGDMDAATLLYSQVNEPIPLACQRNPALPVEVDQVIQRATKKKPSERYPDASSLAEALMQALQPRELRAVIEKAAPLLHNLPLQPAPFIGRELELKTLGQYLDNPQTRLLTISGPGGIGKTRLALTSAETQIGRYENGVFFVPLAPVESPEDVPLAIARAIGFSFPGNAEPVDELVSYLRQRSMLLVLDNFEHLIEAAPTVSQIINNTPKVQMIITSRQRLQLQGEQVFPLHGLSFADWRTIDEATDYEAVQLFMQSARKLRPDFALSISDLAPLNRICKLTQGLPLAILLAAGWIELLSLAEIADEVSRNLDILQSEMQDLPVRQRSMQAVFNYTWDLLNRQERELLSRLSVFHGGCSVRAAREITGASLPMLRALVNKSLVQVSPSDRYELHELLRRFAAEKLVGTPDELPVKNTHSRYYLMALSKREEALFSDRFLDVLSEVDDDLANVRAAWRWATKKRFVGLLQKAMPCLFHYHKRQKHVQYLVRDAQLVIDRFSKSELADERFVMAQALLFQGWDMPNREDKELIERGLAILHEKALESLDTRVVLAFGLFRLGHIESLSNIDRSRDLLNQSLDLYRAAGDRRGESGVLLVLSYLSGYNADFIEEERLARASHTIRIELGNPLEQAECLQRIAYALAMQGKSEEALEIAQMLMDIAETMPAHHAVAVSGMLPIIYRQTGFFEEAYDHYGEVMEANDVLGDPIIVRSSSFWQAWVGIQLGKYEEFLTIAERQSGAYSDRYYQGHMDLGVAAARLALGDPGSALGAAQRGVESFRLGGQLPRLGEGLAILSLIERALGDLDDACASLSEAIKLAIKMKSPPVLCYCLAPAALILEDSGRPEEAVAIYSLALQHPIAANSRWFCDVAGDAIEEIARSLTTETAEAARKRGVSLDLWETANELQKTLETITGINTDLA